MPGAAIDPWESEFVSDLFAKVMARMTAILEHEIVVVCGTRDVSQPHSGLGDDTGI